MIIRRCKKGKLCDFRPILVTRTIQVERCVNCGRKVRYVVDSRGRINNARYLRDHRRDTLQPGGRTGKEFEEVYGREPIKKAEEIAGQRKRKERNQEEWESLRKKVRAGRKTI